MISLFDPIQIGKTTCQNRLFMAPLTRTRNYPDGVPSSLMAQYYAQRAEAGLIVSESIAICLQGYGFLNASGIWMEEQIEGWKHVTEAVHQKGGKIIAQLWHGGRIVFPTMSGGQQPVSASDSAAPGIGHTWEGKRPYPKARALKISEIHQITELFAKAARNARKAGFDGVQIHGANGYLLDQFLRDSSNQRTDEYGYSPENRMRFLKEVCQAVIAEIGSEQVGVRLSPNGEILGCIDSQPEKLFLPVAKMLNELNIAWLALKEFNPHASKDNLANPLSYQPKLSPEIRKIFKKPLVLNGNYNFESAKEAVQDGFADAISFGRDFIANPDLVKRFKTSAPLNKEDKTTWYGQFLTDKEHGYTDWPTI
ncbi:alkene reductase [Acetobacteraceae bacterium]|nr:alkene reductase [Acetobacteraceae bacterium]